MQPQQCCVKILITDVNYYFIKKNSESSLNFNLL